MGAWMGAGSGRPASHPVCVDVPGRPRQEEGGKLGAARRRSARSEALLADRRREGEPAAGSAMAGPGPAGDSRRRRSRVARRRLDLLPPVLAAAATLLGPLLLAPAGGVPAHHPGQAGRPPGDEGQPQQARPPVVKDVHVSIRPNKMLHTVEQQWSEAIPVEVSEALDLLVEFKASPLGSGSAAKADVASSIRFAPHHLQFTRGGERVQTFRVQSDGPGLFSIAFNMTGEDADRLVRNAAPIPLRTSPREALQLHPAVLDTLHTGIASQSYRLTLPQAANVVVRPEGGGALEFKPATLAFSRAGATSAYFTVTAKNVTGDGTALPPPELEWQSVPVAFALRCPEPEGGEAGECDAEKFAAPAGLLARIQRPNAIVPDREVAKVGEDQPVVRVALRQPADAVVLIRATNMNLNTTMLRMTHRVSEGYFRIQKVQGSACARSPCKHLIHYEVKDVGQARPGVTPVKHAFETLYASTAVLVSGRSSLEVPLEPVLGIANRSLSLDFALPEVADLPAVADLRLSATPLGEGAAALTVSPAELAFDAGARAGTFKVMSSEAGSFTLRLALAGADTKFIALPRVNQTVIFQHAFFDPSFRFDLEYGIGGLNEELRSIVRRAFLSRMLPQGTVRSLGVGQVKGILLYGPPGCGKTTVARQIGRMLHSYEPTIVVGPQIVSKYLGESEGKMRALFEAAEAAAAKGDQRLHLIVFDEFDALAKPRGRGRGEAADQ